MNGSGSLDLSIRADCGKRIVPYLRRRLRAAHRLLKSPPRELSVALVSDATMADLHQRYLGISGPTDVLSFELERDRRGRVTAGEVIVCIPQARRQGTAGLKREALLCAVHGLLHLCGFDDRTRRGYAVMHGTEDRILSQVGAGKVFGRGVER